jgi:hypothetical protein
MDGPECWCDARATSVLRFAWATLLDKTWDVDYLKAFHRCRSLVAFVSFVVSFFVVG